MSIMNYQTIPKLVSLLLLPLEFFSCSSTPKLLISSLKLPIQLGVTPAYRGFVTLGQFDGVGPSINQDDSSEPCRNCQNSVECFFSHPSLFYRFNLFNDSDQLLGFSQFTHVQVSSTEVEPRVDLRSNQRRRGAHLLLSLSAPLLLVLFPLLLLSMPPFSTNVEFTPFSN